MMTSTGGDHVAHMRSAMCADWPSSFRAEEGNWGLVGNNTPVFLVREPLQFSDFIHAQKLRRSGFHRLSL